MCTRLFKAIIPDKKLQLVGGPGLYFPNMGFAAKFCERDAICGLSGMLKVNNLRSFPPNC